jgi:hypothetical protein
MAKDSPWNGVGKYTGTTSGGLISLGPVNVENMDS